MTFDPDFPYVIEFLRVGRPDTEDNWCEQWAGATLGRAQWTLAAFSTNCPTPGHWRLRYKTRVLLTKTV